MKGASLKYLESTPCFLSQQPTSKESNKLIQPVQRKNAQSKQSLLDSDTVPKEHRQQKFTEETFSKNQHNFSNSSNGQYILIDSKGRQNIKLLLSRTSCSPNTSRMYERLTSNELQEMNQRFFLMTKNKSETNVRLLELEH